MADGFAGEAAVLAVLAAVGAALWYLYQGGVGRAEAAVQEASSIFERVQEVSQNGELVIDPVSGVFYDDPEQGSLDDEAGDDRNVSFAAANELLEDVGAYIDPTTYAPDVEGDAVAPDSGVLADAGESQNFGTAPEQENDDLTERAAESNMSEDEKAAFDRLANYDDPSRLSDDGGDDPAETSTSSTSSSTSTSATSSSSGSTSSDPADSSDDPLSAFSQWTDEDDVDGDPATGGLVA